MKGNYKGILCQTGEQRIDGEYKKVLLYADRPGENDEQALAVAGFVDLENGLWAKVLALDEYKEILEEFARKEQVHKQEQIIADMRANEENIRRQVRLNAENERMAARRAKMRVLKLEFEGASIFAVVIAVALLILSILGTGEKDVTPALPLWASLALLPIIIVGAAFAAFKKLPEIYLAIAGMFIISAIIACSLISIILVIAAAAFVTFFFLTRKITQFKNEPEYPTYFDKQLSDIK